MFVRSILVVLLSFHLTAAGEPWPRHTIDASSRGADGVRVADVNGDGHPDMTTGWEEGGVVRVYLNPGPTRAKEPWPAVTVGQVKSPEDAVFVDLDGDGATDVVSCCEGKTRTIYVHWAPAEKERYLDESAWRTEALPHSKDFALWMFCEPMQIDQQRGVDLVVGSKGSNGAVGWYESPENPRDLAAWRWHPMVDAGWIMTLRRADMDQADVDDLLFSDRMGPDRGVYFLAVPSKSAEDPSTTWRRQRIGGTDREVMFLALGKLRPGRFRDVVAAVRGSGLLWMQHGPDYDSPWSEVEIPLPPDVGTGKGVAIGDLDLDGHADLAFTCESAGGKHGVMWLEQRPGDNGAPTWLPHPISGTEQGIKFDRIELLDLDADGDLDLVTCEERDQLGVIWYENPAR